MLFFVCASRRDVNTYSDHCFLIHVHASEHEELDHTSLQSLPALDARGSVATHTYVHDIRTVEPFCSARV